MKSRKRVSRTREVSDIYASKEMVELEQLDSLEREVAVNVIEVYEMIFGHENP